MAARWGLGLVLFVGSFVGACGARSELRIDDAEPVVSAHCAAPAIEVRTPEVIVDSNGVAAIQLLFTGTEWALLVRQNIGGRYEAAVYFIRVDGTLRLGPLIVTLEHETSIDFAHMTLGSGGLWVSWVADGAVLARTLAPNGDFGETRTLFFDGVVRAATLYSAGSELDIVLRADAAAIPSVVRVSTEGSPSAGPDLLYGEAAGDGSTYSFGWLWPDRVFRFHGVPGEPFWVSRSSFAYGVPATPGERVFRSEGAAHLGSLLGGTPTVLGMFDTDVGARVLEVESDAALPRYEVSEGKRPRLVRDRDCGYAVLVDHGELTSTNAVSTDLDVHLLDVDFRRRAPIAQVFVGPPACVESHELAGGPEGTFGVAWTAGCTGTRRVFFTTVTAAAGD